ncbi:hypothetical protein [Gemmiger formicilis]|uniref:hypothetical protein n=1 Tax=Gemmiger formicilis TaxID=745368 RepID=UPI003993763A
MICFPLDNTPYEAKDMGTYLATRTRGVFSSDGNLAVTPSESGLSVSVSPGLAWLKWSDYWGTAALQEQALTLDLDTADGALKRIDAIVCRLDKVNNRAEIVVKKGAPSSAPIVVPPVRDANYDELYIATVLIGAGVISISASAITDQRLNEDYCGLMRDGVTGIPTAPMQAQVQQLIDHLRAEVDGIEQGSEVMLKTVYDADGDGVVDKAAAVPWDGVTGKPGTFTPSTHNHDDRYYTETEMNTKLNGKADSGHTHTSIRMYNSDWSGTDGSITPVYANANKDYVNLSAGNDAGNKWPHVSCQRINGHALNMSLSGTTLSITW